MSSSITRLYAREKWNVELLRRVVSVEALHKSWREYFYERLQRLSS